VQAIRKEEAGDARAAVGFEEKAIRQMNLRDRNKMPSAQTTIVIDTGAGMLVNPI
jgi:hypothetical protein